MESNMQKMRVAARHLLCVIDEMGLKPWCADDPLAIACEKLDAALAIPLCNCEVGTAQEQIKRWEEFCIEHHEYWRPDKSMTAIQRCNCPCKEGNGCNYFIWAQMPYEKGGTE